MPHNLCHLSNASDYLLELDIVCTGDHGRLS